MPAMGSRRNGHSRHPIHNDPEHMRAAHVGMEHVEFFATNPIRETSQVV